MEAFEFLDFSTISFFSKGILRFFFSEGICSAESGALNFQQKKSRNLFAESG